MNLAKRSHECQRIINSLKHVRQLANTSIENKIIRMKMKLLFLILFQVLVINSFARETPDILYKKVDAISLHMRVIYPDNMDANVKYPAMVFFHGGGWLKGSIQQLEPHGLHFAKRGMICFLVEYRVSSQHGSSPFESLKDAKSAIRFIRKNADRFHIDPDKLIAGGGSAGGHLAAASALIEHYNEDDDDLTVSCSPDALVLFNPVIDNGPGGYGYERIGAAYKDFSPLHNIKAGAPPTIIFLGTEDDLIPVETAKYYKTVMEKVGSRCDLFLYEGQGHGFFNYQRGEYYQITLAEADNFLVSLGYLE